MECMAQEPVLFEDILCQIIDMIGPEVHLLFCASGCVFLFLNVIFDKLVTFFVQVIDIGRLEIIFLFSFWVNSKKMKIKLINYNPSRKHAFKPYLVTSHP